jgi:adenosylcobinamide-GDP ribazoletransferase
MNGDQIRPKPPGGAAPSRRPLAAALTAVAFLTRLPLPRGIAGPGALEASLAWFPLAGALVGCLAAAALTGAAVLWPSPLPALAAVAMAVLVTGGFHEDGLADTADAFAAGGDLERRLRVLDDPRIGAVGTVVLVLVLLGRIAALAALPLVLAAATLVAAHCLARWTVPALLWRLPYVRGEGGIAARLKRGATASRLGWASLVSAVVLAAVVGAVVLAGPLTAGTRWTTTGWTAASLVAGLAAALASVLVVTVAAGALFRRRFGGVTGDLLGATCQVAELAVSLAMLAVVGRAG